ncbi:hypothetical protein NUW54_g11228 [Trametes sanguinea]|uniref:Uncharacterized protein n=1 Tax=Trametes sanguinea TaxID=158606 RepID=A0ACC1NJ95_9APHY|nr:hypothetical protein NUW54_g11228 [Trametes sanguinea]
MRDQYPAYGLCVGRGGVVLHEMMRHMSCLCPRSSASRPPVYRFAAELVHPLDSVGSAILAVTLAAAGGAVTWWWLRGPTRHRTPFVKLYASPHSATLPKEGSRDKESSTSLAQLVHGKVPALGPDATFDGVWWLPGYTFCAGLM